MGGIGEGSRVDHEGQELPAKARWLAWVAAILLAAGGISVSALNARSDGSDDGYVAAAGRTTITVDGTTTTALPADGTTTTRRPAQTTATTVPRTTTTVPKAAAAILAAIGSTTTAPPTTAPPASSTTVTTRPPTTTTTVPPTTSTSTTSTTIPTKAAVTVVNDHPQPFKVTVDGQVVEVPAGQQSAALDVTPDSSGNDVVDAVSTTDGTCTTNLTGDLFNAGGHYKVTVSAGPTSPWPPDIKVTST